MRFFPVAENLSAQGIRGVYKPFRGTANHEPGKCLRRDLLFKYGTTDCADAGGERHAKGFKPKHGQA